mmetsp:Transcript_13823/g.35268  ORF Transcript_13823/g.35268 Transcript_13823/m.35268 type:complete len:272 (+) Transcript_13823:139-954(+)
MIPALSVAGHECTNIGPSEPTGSTGLIPPAIGTIHRSHRHPRRDTPRSSLLGGGLLLVLLLGGLADLGELQLGPLEEGEGHLLGEDDLGEILLLDADGADLVSKLEVLDVPLELRELPDGGLHHPVPAGVVRAKHGLRDALIEGALVELPAPLGLRAHHKALTPAVALKRADGVPQLRAVRVPHKQREHRRPVLRELLPGGPGGAGGARARAPERRLARALLGGDNRGAARGGGRGGRGEGAERGGVGAEGGGRDEGGGEGEEGGGCSGHG